MMGTASRLPDPRQLPLRDKLAQLIFVRIGSNLPPIRTVEDDEERILRTLETCPVGGLLLFNGGSATKESLARLQQRSAWPLLVAADMERGVGQQVRDYTVFPHAMAFRLPDRGDEMNFDDGEMDVDCFVDIIAREARDVGIHITFGPVADVNTNPRNPIISIRAFSDDPNIAAQMVAPYVATAEGRGLFSTAKHFPGHGDTYQDSHDALPSVKRTLDELRVCELVPFQAAIDAGCSLVMTAHVAFPRIDPSGVPATLSPILLKDLLRGEMGFQGVVCSDSLLMAGVRDRFASEGDMALAALNAGVDLLLDIHDPAAVVHFLLACVDNGTLDFARVVEAFTRVWTLKQKVFGQPQGDLPLPRWIVPPTTAGEFAARLASQVAQGAVTIISERGASPLPFDPDQPLAAIVLKPFELPSDPPEQPLAAALRERFRDVQYVQLGPRSGADEFTAAERVARERRQLLVAMIVKPAAWHAFGLLPPQREFVERLTRQQDAVLVSLGVPYALADFPDAKVRICTYSDVPVSQQALAHVLASS